MLAVRSFRSCRGMVGRVCVACWCGCGACCAPEGGPRLGIGGHGVGGARGRGGRVAVAVGGQLVVGGGRRQGGREANDGLLVIGGSA